MIFWKFYLLQGSTQTIRELKTITRTTENKPEDSKGANLNDHYLKTIQTTKAQQSTTPKKCYDILKIACRQNVI